MKKLAFVPVCALCLAALAGGCDGDDVGGPTPTTGSIQATTSTAGDTLDPDGYTVTVDGTQSQAVGINDVVTFADLEEGSHSVELSGVAKNCTVSGENPRGVSVTAGETAQEGFGVTCAVALFDHIAFMSNRDGNPEVYVMNSDGSNPTKLTNELGVDLPRAWSPDGTQLAFESYRDWNWEVYVMNADGSNPTNLTNDPGGDSYPVWKPDDGTQIAFVSNRDGNYEVYVMNADGSNPTNLTNDPGSDSNPVWSPIR